MDPSLDARGSERSLKVTLSDPAEGSDDITNNLDDSALVERRRHGRGEGSRARFDCWTTVLSQSTALYAKCGDSYEPRVSARYQRVPGIAQAIPA